MRRRPQRVRDFPMKSWLVGREMTNVATAVQDRDSIVVLDRVYCMTGNNDLPLRVSLEEIVSDYVIIVRTTALRFCVICTAMVTKCLVVRSAHTPQSPSLRNSTRRFSRKNNSGEAAKTQISHLTAGLVLGLVRMRVRCRIGASIRHGVPGNQAF